MFSFQSLTTFGFIVDEVSLFIVFLTVFVLFVSYLVTLSYSQVSLSTFTLIFMLVFCVVVFTADSLFFLYVFYEASLLPILYIIIKWGSYPERSLRGLMLLVYTSVFTFPFLAVMFSFYVDNSSLSFSYISLSPFHISPSLLFTVIVFLTFAVKLPIYGLHFWLPIAHVEAPTFGSIILAGILLKLGGAGLLRLRVVFDFSSLLPFMLAYFIVAMLYVTLVCRFQSDFKRLVAYSSVSHIIAIPFLVIANTSLAAKSLVLLILFHGLSSPILFILVGVIYSMFQTRQLVAIRGLLIIRPLIRFIFVLTFFFTLSAPPFPSFVSEVLFMVSSFYISPSLLYLFLLFVFFSMVYNLNWLSSLLFSSFSPSLNSGFRFGYLSFLVLISLLLMSVEILFLISFV